MNRQPSKFESQKTKKKGFENLVPKPKWSK